MPICIFPFCRRGLARCRCNPPPPSPPPSLSQCPPHSSGSQALQRRPRRLGGHPAAEAGRRQGLGEAGVAVRAGEQAGPRRRTVPPPPPTTCNRIPVLIIGRSYEKLLHSGRAGSRAGEIQLTIQASSRGLAAACFCNNLLQKLRDCIANIDGARRLYVPPFPLCIFSCPSLSVFL
jgi:hypothetical protein